MANVPTQFGVVAESKMRINFIGTFEKLTENHIGGKDKNDADFQNYRAHLLLNYLRMEKEESQNLQLWQYEKSISSVPYIYIYIYIEKNKLIDF